MSVTDVPRSASFIEECGVGESVCHPVPESSSCFSDSGVFLRIRLHLLVLRRIQRVQERRRVWRGWHLRIGSRQTVLGGHCARQGKR
jgi:hypothetical protein